MQESKSRFWILIGVAVVVGALVGFGATMLATPAPPPTATFTVVAYHWGFAIYDEDGVEIPKIEVARGTEVTLLVIGAEALSTDIHEEFGHRTVEAWENKTAFGGKTGPEIHDEIEDAEDQGLMDHSVRISGYDVDIKTKAMSPSPVKVTFTADTAGTFDIICNFFCGWGHQYMALTGGFVVS